MPNPVIIPIPEWTWTLVAQKVVTGSIDRLVDNTTYYYTYRITGSTAPPDPTLEVVPEEAIRIFMKSENEIIDSDEIIDIYLMTGDKDSTTSVPGKVRVNI